MRRWFPSAAAVLAVFALLVACPATMAAAAPGPITSPPPVSKPSTGYWLAAADGGVFAFGDAEFLGSTGGIKLDKPVVGMATPPSSGRGYWLVGSDGGVFTFGDTLFYGSTGGQKLNRPIVGITSTPTGLGYWLVAADGGIFAFGDAGFFGSTGGMKLNQPIIALAPTPTGQGYWLVARDGGVFAFGDAEYFGSTGDIKLNSPIVAMAATPAGRGYWLTAGDGGVFTFGDAPVLGSTGAVKLNKPIVAMAPTGIGDGYWLAASDGGVFAFGDAGYFGSTGATPLSSPVLALVAKPKPGRVESSVFYYPWYGNLDVDGTWHHWDNAGHRPPADIAANFYPTRGPYSSASRPIVDAQMADIAAAGIDTVITSWWGRGSFEDRALPNVVAAARARGLRVAIHVEPYEGRTPSTVESDVAYLSSQLGITEYWVYLSDGVAPEAWVPLTSRFADFTFWAHGHSPSNGVRGVFQAFAARAGFDGVYTYDPVSYAFSTDFRRFCREARVRGLRCSPSVSPGYDGTRGVPDPTVRDRRAGDRYDESWVGAFGAGADVVSITSYNEWHEGTQIEPSLAGICTGSFCYSSFEGAYGLRGAAAEGAYLDRTRFWTDGLRR
ncbi:MAG: hypothetical protein QOF60_2742 [Actinomycetota bacterium]|nr:hypothetical protein [Actinomycetota bacterium]